MSRYKRLKTTGLGEKLGQLTREDKKIKLVNKENNVYFLQFIKKIIKKYKDFKDELYRITNPLKVIIQYDHQSVYGTLDTGCNFSMIDYSLVKNKEDIVPGTEFDLQTGNGSKSKLEGEILLKIKINGYEYEINAFVLKGATFNIILGNDFFFKYGLIVDYKKKEIRFDNGDSIKMDPIWLEYLVKD